MKIAPITGPIQAQVGNAQGSPSRVEAAKAAYEGMTMTPVDDPVQQEPVRTRPKIQMRTNYSTNRDDTQIGTTETQESAPLNQVESPEAEVTRPISPQLAELAKQRRALQVKEREIAEREKALSSQPVSTGIDLERLKSRPLEVLQESGISYDQLTEAILAESSGVPKEVREVQEQLKSLKEEFQKTLSDRDSLQEQQVLSQIQKEADQLIESNPDEFELTKGLNAQKEVSKLVKRYYDETGDILDTQEAAKWIEDQLLEDHLKFTGFKKIRSKLAPEPQVQSQPQRQIRTLTNRDTAQPYVDRRARAIAAARGQKL